MGKGVNLNNLLKQDILWLYNHYCRHGHRYTEHPLCYRKEQQVAEKIVMLDIESGGSLTGDFGYTFSYSLKELNGKIISNVIKPDEVRNDGIRDKRLVRDFCRAIKPYDVIVVYYGCDKPNRHDIPFLRTRAVKWDIDDFPVYKEKKVVDVYDIIKTKFKLARRRMVDACRLFNIPFSNHPVNPNVWQNAMCGDRKALKYIVTHNREDVISLDLLYQKVIGYKEVRTTL
jgi:uncharacterized protein YprB with RNaseH-like and TPR domain